MKKIKCLTIALFLCLMCTACGGSGGSGDNSYAGKWTVYAPNVYAYCRGITYNESGKGALDWNKEIIYQNGNNITYEHWIDKDGCDTYYGTINNNGGFSVYANSSAGSCSSEFSIEVSNLIDGVGNFVYIWNDYCPSFQCYHKYEGTISRK